MLQGEENLYKEDERKQKELEQPSCRLREVWDGGLSKVGFWERFFWGGAMEVIWERLYSREMLNKLFFNSNDVDKHQK